VQASIGEAQGSPRDDFLLPKSDTEDEQLKPQTPSKEVTFNDEVEVKATDELGQYDASRRGDNIHGIQFRSSGDPLLMIHSGDKTCIVKPRTQPTPAIKPDAGQTLLTPEQVRAQVLYKLRGDAKRPAKSGHLRRHGPAYDSPDTNAIHEMAPGAPEGMPLAPSPTPRLPHPPREKLFRRAFPRGGEASTGPGAPTPVTVGCGELSITGKAARRKAILAGQRADRPDSASSTAAPGFKGKKVRAFTCLFFVVKY
jgi:hypothetical protein